MFKRFRFAGLAIVFMLAIALVACGSDDKDESASDDSKTDNGNAESGVELGETDITFPYVAWAGATARTFLIAEVLEEVGYTVDVTQVEAGPMWSSVADGSSDFTASAWLPATHQSYWEQYSDDLVDVNTIIDKAPLALTVPAYMEDVNSIEDLKGNTELGDSVDWTIVGIDPGAGIMQNTVKALESYELADWELLESSEAAMISELQTKMENEEPIIVPLWKPHWAFAEMDLKMLEDPQEIYGGDGDHINIIANKEFEEKSPAAYKVLEQYTADYDQLDELMGKIHNGEDPKEVAQQYLKDNPDLLEKWTEGVTE